MTAESRSMRTADTQEWGTAVTARTSNPRIEGVAKVTGAALYVDDVGENQFGSPLDAAVVVTSTIAVGRIRSFDLSAALAVLGIRM